MLRALREQNKIVASYGEGTGKTRQEVYNFFKSHGFRKITEDTKYNSWNVVVRDREKAIRIQQALGRSKIQYSYGGNPPVISGYYDTFQRPEDLADIKLKEVVKKLGGYIYNTEQKGIKYSIGFRLKTPSVSDIEKALEGAGLEVSYVGDFNIPVRFKS